MGTGPLNEKEKKFTLEQLKLKLSARTHLELVDFIADLWGSESSSDALSLEDLRAKIDNFAGAADVDECEWLTHHEPSEIRQMSFPSVSFPTELCFALGGGTGSSEGKPLRNVSVKGGIVEFEVPNSCSKCHGKGLVNVSLQKNCRDNYRIVGRAFRECECSTGEPKERVIDELAHVNSNPYMATSKNGPTMGGGDEGAGQQN
uniref:Uncharacterized protein n=1 Tax=Chromera velia CCMP2878 TaxID=1169474 RepID=A0A0G4HYQ6_9ALVE|eukprot:Cvel_9554.t1-p1 / transcript=Cvel_9554.t1 / gene=Cvel_9554 / organism=Chromera_velia_CCMP2878 / gene_product=hypothetical protein / transcript_product=hypothetical protein / location=Cvel_scaffold553:57055-58167(-) / protein_length=202 / sequence_SO=supercontig / SO=protein_coding / is_pseudo=false